MKTHIRLLLYIITDRKGELQSIFFTHSHLREYVCVPHTEKRGRWIDYTKLHQVWMSVWMPWTSSGSIMTRIKWLLKLKEWRTENGNKWSICPTYIFIVILYKKFERSTQIMSLSAVYLIKSVLIWIIFKANAVPSNVHNACCDLNYLT